MPRVTIVKRYDREFRLPLYHLLRERLNAEGIDFQLIIGQPNKFEKMNIQDALRTNPFGPIVDNRYFYFGHKLPSFQNAFPFIADSDLTIVQQSNSEILNYMLLLRRNIFNIGKLAFWGHGINFQAKSKSGFLQRFKLFYSRHVDHWFAYNELTSDILRDTGYPLRNITVLNNTIDVREEKSLYDSIGQHEITNLRSRYEIAAEDKVGIFCGSLYRLKRIDYLLECLTLIRAEARNFHFFVLGNGEMEDQVKIFEARHTQWFHFLGFRNGREKQMYLRLADFQLMPGSVGLNIIDSFYSQAPLVTTANAYHGPEILYLRDHVNGVMTNNDKKDYVAAVVRLVRDSSHLSRLKHGCLECSQIYTLENIANRFDNGIVKTLGGTI